MKKYLSADCQPDPGIEMEVVLCEFKINSHKLRHIIVTIMLK